MEFVSVRRWLLLPCGEVWKWYLVLLLPPLEKRSSLFGEYCFVSVVVLHVVFPEHGSPFLILGGVSQVPHASSGKDP